MDRKWLLTTLLGLLLAAPVRAEETGPKEAPKADEAKKPPAMAENKGTREHVAKLAAKFDVPEKDVSTLRAKGLGWGEIGHALAISQKAGAPMADILKLRDSGMGWGRIARKYGFKLGEVTGKSGESMRDSVKAERRHGNVERRRHEPPGKRGHGDAGRVRHGRGNGPKR